jgi:hypothetical protein
MQQRLMMDWAVEITTGRMPVCYRGLLRLRFRIAFLGG